jgi:hypothetical protein
VARVRLYPAGAGEPEAYTPRMPALQRVEAESAVREGFRCSFCGNEPADGRDLIAGPQVFICDECIATCADMLAGEDGAGDEERPEPDRGNPDGDEPASRPTVFRLLTQGDVARLLTMDDLIDEMGVTLSRFSAGEAVQPLRTVIPVGRENEVFAVMPAYLRAQHAHGVDRGSRDGGGFRVNRRAAFPPGASGGPTRDAARDHDSSDAVAARLRPFARRPQHCVCGVGRRRAAAVAPAARPGRSRSR